MSTGRVRKGLLIAGFSMSALLFDGSLAIAEIAQCSGGSSTGHPDGFETFAVLGQPITYMFGTIATMQIRTASTCTSDTDTSTNHVYAVAGLSGINNSPVGLGWARVGYRRYVGTTTQYFFAEWSQAGGPPTRTSFGAVGGTSVTGTVDYQLGCDCIKLLLGSNVMTTGIDPEDEWDPETNASEYEAFAKYPQSDVPGLSSTRTQYSNLQTEGVSGHRALNSDDKTRTYPSNANVRWSSSTGITSDNKFQIWCSSVIDCG